MVDKRMVVAMSGGVDSTVAALLMKSAGEQISHQVYYLWYHKVEVKGCSTCCCQTFSAELDNKNHYVSTLS